MTNRNGVGWHPHVATPAQIVVFRDDADVAPAMQDPTEFARTYTNSSRDGAKIRSSAFGPQAGPQLSV